MPGFRGVKDAVTAKIKKRLAEMQQPTSFGRDLAQGKIDKDALINIAGSTFSMGGSDGLVKKAAQSVGGKIASVADESAKPLWEIIDRQTGHRIGSTYRNFARARGRVDRLDNEYGAVRYQARRVTPKK